MVPVIVKQAGYTFLFLFRPPPPTPLKPRTDLESEQASFFTFPLAVYLATLPLQSSVVERVTT